VCDGPGDRVNRSAPRRNAAAAEVGGELELAFAIA
jgi:hypothetical protein